MGFWNLLNYMIIIVFTVAAQKGSYFGLIKMERKWEKVDKGSPAASSQTEEFESSKFWMIPLLENKTEDKFLISATNGLWATALLKIKTCRQMTPKCGRGRTKELKA